MNPMRLAAYARNRNLAYGWRARTLTWALDVTTPAAPRWTEHGHTEHVPYVRRSGVGARPRPGCDTVSYLTGKHAPAWREATLAAVSDSDHPAAGALRWALDTGMLPAPPATAKGADVVGVCAGGAWLHDDPALAQWWSVHLRADLGSGAEGVCLCCGRVGELARLIPAYLSPKRLGVRGSGDLALYPTPKRGAAAYRSSSGMCLDCATSIGAAVESLSSEGSHHHILSSGGGVLLWWNPEGNDALFPLGPLLERPSRDALAAAPLEGRVCALLLTTHSPGRITVRSHWDMGAREAATRVAAWYDRIAVGETWSGGEVIPSMTGLHRVATRRWDRGCEEYVATRSTSVSEAELWMAAMEGHTPRRHIQAVHKAIRGDNRIRAGRVAFLQMEVGS